MASISVKSAQEKIGIFLPLSETISLSSIKILPNASFFGTADGIQLTNTLAMNFVHELDEKKFTHTLWEICTECIVVFPDGIGVLPWMLCGTNTIGEATAKKMEEFRLVVWGMHGIYGAGKTMDETFGLIETVEKGGTDIYAYL